MNLSGKILGTGLALLSALFFLGCEDPNQIGLELRADSDQVGVAYKEIELESYVIKNDSILTSSSARMLAGNYQNENLGLLQAEGYTRITYGQEDLPVPENAVYDSLILYMLSDFNYGPGIVDPQEFFVHRLTEEIIDTAAYFSSDELEYDPEPLGTANYLLPVFSDTLVVFRMNDDFGRFLFDASRDTTVLDPEDQSTLFDLIYGFAFTSAATNNSLIRYDQEDNSSRLALYYHEPGDTVVSVYNFQFNTIFNFNRIIADRTGTPLEGIGDNPFTEFSPSDGNVYGQAGTGLITKISFAPVIEYFDSLPGVIFNEVVLEIKIDSLDYNEYPPSEVTFFYAGENNKRIRNANLFEGINIEGSTELIRPGYSVDNRTYSAPITVYASNVLNDFQYIEVLVYPPEFGLTHTINHFRIDPANIKAKIYYTRLK